MVFFKSDYLFEWINRKKILLINTFEGNKSLMDEFRLSPFPKGKIFNIKKFINNTEKENKCLKSAVYSTEWLIFIKFIGNTYFHLIEIDLVFFVYIAKSIFSYKTLYLYFVLSLKLLNYHYIYKLCYQIRIICVLFEVNFWSRNYTYFVLCFFTQIFLWLIKCFGCN